MIPVVIIHTGSDDYSKVCALKAAENNHVYFLGDTDPQLNSSNITYVELNSYTNTFKSFEDIYEHFNTTPYDYEVFCFKRWFILNEFILANNIPICFYIDSDVLLFSNVSNLWKWFHYNIMTLVHRTAAVSSYVTTLGLSTFLKFLMNVYSEKRSYEFIKLKNHFVVRQNCGLTGGVCDMTLFELFHYNEDSGGGPGKIGEMMQIYDDATFDHNINVSDHDYRMSNGIKAVEINNGYPYVDNLRLGKKIKFHTLHFQGVAKPYMIPTFNLSNSSKPNGS